VHDAVCSGKHDHTDVSYCVICFFQLVVCCCVVCCFIAGVCPAACTGAKVRGRCDGQGAQLLGASVIQPTCLCICTWFRLEHSSLCLTRSIGTLWQWY
jgi:hypothetical protein